MAKGNILKKKDSDLISANVKPGVDIFGVTGGYGGLEGVTKFVVGLSYSGNDNDNATGAGASNDIRFYDEGLKVICMGCVTTSTQNGTIGRMFYYFEITKSNLTISNYRDFWITDGTFTYNDSGTYMYIQNIGGANRYCFCCDSGGIGVYGKSVYFNGTNLVEGGSGGTPIGVSRFDLKDSGAYNISQLSSLGIYNQTFFATNSVVQMGQTFTTIGGGDVGMIRAYGRGNGGTFSQPAICKIYNNTFTTLLGTSTNQVTLNVDGAGQELEFRFSGINLSAATQYAFLLTSPTGGNSGTGAFRISYDYDLYSGGKMYIGGVVQNGLDLYFDIIIGGYRGNFTGSVESRHIEDSYNCYMNATGFLNFN